MRRQKTRGPARMRELGRIGVTVWFDAAELAQIDKARGDYTKRATFVWAAATSAAREKVAAKQKG